MNSTQPSPTTHAVVNGFVVCGYWRLGDELSPAILLDPATISCADCRRFLAERRRKTS